VSEKRRVRRCRSWWLHMLAAAHGTDGNQVAESGERISSTPATSL
jgi:hypothetical protein